MKPLALLLCATAAEASNHVQSTKLNTLYTQITEQIERTRYMQSTETTEP